MLKKLFSFSILKEEEVEVKQETINEDKSIITKTTKEKQKIPKSFFLKYPNRDLRDDAELFHGMEFNRGIKNSLETNVQVVKRIENDNKEGIFSDKSQAKYIELYKELFAKNDKIQELNSKENKTEEETKELEQIKKDIVSLKVEVQSYENIKQNLFNNTAETRAQNKLFNWWIVHLAGLVNDKGEEKEYFIGKNYKERMNDYDEIFEKSATDPFIRESLEKIATYTSLWFFGSVSNQEEFDKAVKILDENKELK